jgi:glycerophosphoryl diester phosphodiesterase
MTASAESPLWPLPLWIAHRGAGKLAPENTLAAFRLGAAHGYRAFECDVKLSADDQPFLLHDATLERTTSAAGPAGQRAWSELSRVDAGSWHSPRYAGEPVPSLEAIARYVQANSFALNIEIKPTPGTEQHTGEVVGSHAKRLWQSNEGSLVFSSFRPEALLGARVTAPDIPRALLLDTLWPGWWDVARQLECRALVTNHTLMGAALIKQLHDAGLKALVYTVNDPAPARALLDMGIDGIITDAVDRFPPAAAGGGQPG